MWFCFQLCVSIFKEEEKGFLLVVDTPFWFLNEPGSLVVFDGWIFCPRNFFLHNWQVRLTEISTM